MHAAPFYCHSKHPSKKAPLVLSELSIYLLFRFEIYNNFERKPLWSVYANSGFEEDRQYELIILLDTVCSLQIRKENVLEVIRTPLKTGSDWKRS